jgi:nucleoid-associated protein YgaU
MVYGYEDDDVDIREREAGYPMPEERDIEPEDLMRRRQDGNARRRSAPPEQKRTVNLLAGLCAVLFVVCFVLGVGLIRNQDEITRMETELRQMSTALRNHFAAQTVDELAPVFAEDDPVIGPDVVANEPENIASEQATITRPAYEDTPPNQPTTIFAQPEETALVPQIPETYTIQPGDSLIAISLRFFQNEYMVEEIMALNGIDDPDLIVAGRTIALPRR